MDTDTDLVSLRFSGFGFRQLDFGLRVQALRFRASGSGIEISDFGVRKPFNRQHNPNRPLPSQSLGFGVQGLGFGVWG